MIISVLVTRNLEYSLGNKLFQDYLPNVLHIEMLEMPKLC